MPEPISPPDPLSRQRLGKRGEQMACQALSEAGYHIVQADARIKRCQIDIVAEEGGEYVFVEVKTRRSTTYGTPAESITAKKQRAMITAALEYLAAHDMLAQPWRIDVVAILLTHGPPQIEIIRHAVEDHEI